MCELKREKKEKKKNIIAIESTHIMVINKIVNDVFTNYDLKECISLVNI